MADGIPFPSGTVQAPDPSIDTGTGLFGDRASGLGPGRVALVGAGPGDVELLTCKAARLIGEADWLVHDALVQPEVLGIFPYLVVVCNFLFLPRRCCPGSSGRG